MMMKPPRRRSLPVALLFALTLLAPARVPLSFRSTFSSSILCTASTTALPADAEVMDVPRHHQQRSLWELSVVWDKVGQFFARLTSGWHTGKDDCAKQNKELSLSGSSMTSLSSSSSNATTTTSATNYTTTASPLRRQLEMEEEDVRALKLVQVARSEEVTRHEHVWAADVEEEENDTNPTMNGTTPATQQQKDDKPTLLGEHMEHHASWSTMLQEMPDDIIDNDAVPHAHHRQLLLYPQDIEMDKFTHHHHDNEEEEDDRGPYYSKDDGQWRSVHKHPLTGALKKRGHGLQHHHRQLLEQARTNMTEKEFAEIQEEAREALVEALRQASKEKEARRTDPNVANSLDSVLDALAVRRPLVGLHGEKKASSAPPGETQKQQPQEETLLSRLRLPGSGGVMGTEPDVANPLPPPGRRSLRRGLQQQQAAEAGVAAAIAGGFSEQQKAEMRQIFYDAALSMIREAAREALSTNQGKTNTGGSNYYPSSQNKNGAINQDAYAAAYNAFINAVSSKAQQPTTGGTSAAPDVGLIASHYGGPGGVGPGDNVITGRGGGGGGAPAKKKSFLEVAREVARHNTPSAGRPPALRGGGGRRGLKDMSLRIPVPLTRDETSNDSTPTLKFNSTDAIFVPLVGQTDTRDVQDAAFSRIRPLGPLIEGSPQAIGGETVHEDPMPCPLPGGGHVHNPWKNEGTGAYDHEWADLLLALVREHQEKKEQQYAPHSTRLLEGEASPPPPPAAAAAAAAAAVAGPPPPPSPPTPSAPDTTTTTATTTTPAATPPTLGTTPSLDLNALAGIFQRPWVGPVPGGMGNQEQPSTAPQTDALGNVIQKMKGGLLSNEGKAAAEMEEKKKKGKEGAKGPQEKDSMGGNLGDGFYDRASSQLMSHSARNFQKMQEAVNSILAQEGAFSDVDEGEDFWK